eukprot:UN12069
MSVNVRKSQENKGQKVVPKYAPQERAKSSFGRIFALPSMLS